MTYCYLWTIRVSYTTANFKFKTKQRHPETVGPLKSIDNPPNKQPAALMARNSETQLISQTLKKLTCLLQAIQKEPARGFQLEQCSDWPGELN